MGALTPASFIEKWKKSTLGESKSGQGAVLHFMDLCEVLGVEKPAEKDLDGSRYCFEKGMVKTGGSRGWADVWKKGCFAWEYKGKGKDLDKAYNQLLSYAAPLENPPLLIVSDMERIIIHTNWTNTIVQTYEILIDELNTPRNLDILRWCFNEPKRLKPAKTIEALTKEASKKFATLAQNMRERGHEAHKVAHFINRIAFCMFAEDVDLLPKNFFTERLYKLVNHPERAEKALSQLFSVMSKGGMYGDDPIDWFNGGLFDDNETLPLTPEDLALLHSAAKMDWQDIDPSIFGTMFERGLDPKKRSQLGAHYTDAEKIMMIVNPVIKDPLLEEWAEIKKEIDEEYHRDISKVKDKKAAAERSQKKMLKLRGDFLFKLEHFKVLDPACGSGNFLYLALKTLKDIELRVYQESEIYRLPKPAIMVTGPHNMLGIELNSYAAELARMTVWIGEIQWCLKNGQQISKNPILKTLKTIENRDALINEDGTEAKWPECDVIVGNPPFLGSNLQEPELGKSYVKRLRKAYKKKINEGVDFVCYWFVKANEILNNNQNLLVGLVSTNSITGGRNNEILKAIAKDNLIVNAWRDEDWVNEGASVRVSLTCFGHKSYSRSIYLDGLPVLEIFSDLRGRTNSSGIDLGSALEIKDNKCIAFQGVIPRGSLGKPERKKLTSQGVNLSDASFVVEGGLARNMLCKPLNPNGLHNKCVVKPFVVAEDLGQRYLDRFIIDFNDLLEEEASLFEEPFAHIIPVKQHRSYMQQESALKTWWKFWNRREKMRYALDKIEGISYIATPRNSKYRLFTFVNKSYLPDCEVVVFSKSDFVFFGILHSKFHEKWTLRKCTFLGKGNTPRYTHKSTFETFPFPKGLEPNRKVEDYDNPAAEKISEAAKRLNELRENWLNPSDLVKRVPEVVEGYPDRILPIDEQAEKELKQRTLTNLYNQRKPWLDNAHKALDEAVAEAYGWSADVSDDEILANLLALNLERSK